MRTSQGEVETGPLVALGVAAVLGLAAVGTGITVVGVGLVLVAVAGAVAFAIGPRTREREQVSDVVVPRTAGPDTQSLLAEQRRLEAQLGDPDQVATVLRPRLAALAAARLAHHGVAVDGPQARALLGDPLWTFLTTPARTGRLPLREFEALLTRVEAL